MTHEQPAYSPPLILFTLSQLTLIPIRIPFVDLLELATVSLSPHTLPYRRGATFSHPSQLGHCTVIYIKTMMPNLGVVSIY